MNKRCRRGLWCDQGSSERLHIGKFIRVALEIDGIVIEVSLYCRYVVSSDVHR
jgi:hypothetical protein